MRNLIAVHVYVYISTLRRSAFHFNYKLNEVNCCSLETSRLRNSYPFSQNEDETNTVLLLFSYLVNVIDNSNTFHLSVLLTLHWLKHMQSLYVVLITLSCYKSVDMLCACMFQYYII